MKIFERIFALGAFVLCGAASVLGNAASDPASLLGNASSNPQSFWNNGAAPALQVDVAGGTYTLTSNSNRFAGSQVAVNGINVLQNATRQFGASGHQTYTRTVSGLQFTVEFSNDRAPWLGVTLRVRNVSNAEIDLTDVRLFSAPYVNAFDGAALDQVEAYTESYSVSDIAPGAQTLTGQTLSSLYYGSLFIPGTENAWFFAYNAPPLWSSSLQFDGIGRTVTALQQFYGRPFPLSPGEEETFDTLYISNAFGLIDGLQAYGNFYHPRTRIEDAGTINGYNTWEYFKKTITSQEITPVLNNLGNFATSGRFHRPFIKYFVPDDGWYIDKGEWRFDPTKFPEGAAGWAQKVYAQGMVPGIWIAPTQVSQAIAQQKNYATLGGSTYQGETVDPSDPVFQQDIFGQIRALRDAGFRYFKTDFLKQAYLFYTQGHYFQHSKYPPERVMREFMEGVRKAVGEDSYWLACNAVIASCADLADAARIGNDIAPDWNTVLAIIPRNSARFWMHDRLWLSDQDFTVIRRTAFMLPGYTQSLQPERNVAGFNNPDEARTWCAYVILTGGPATWSDDPLGTTPAGFDLIRRTMENSSGHQAVPLDLETNRLPSKWVRREPFGIYIGLFNWSDSATALQITSAEIPELREGNVATDVLTDAQYPIGTGGSLTIQLNPHQSACLLVPAFGGF